MKDSYASFALLGLASGAEDEYESAHCLGYCNNLSSKMHCDWSFATAQMEYTGIVVFDVALASM